MLWRALLQTLETRETGYALCAVALFPIHLGREATLTLEIHSPSTVSL